MPRAANAMIVLWFGSNEHDAPNDWALYSASDAKVNPGRPALHGAANVLDRGDHRHVTPA